MLVMQSYSTEVDRPQMAGNQIFLKKWTLLLQSIAGIDFIIPLFAYEKTEP